MLVAADYGAPTIRKRFCLIARCDELPIVWPLPTHNKYGTNGLKRWEPIWPYLELDDWGKSIFGRKKPLAKNTMNRIAKGIEKFVFNNPEPFIIQVNHKGDNFRGQSIYDPLPTITGKNGFGIVTPDVKRIQQDELSENIISPFIIQYHSETTSNGVRAHAVTEPLKTIDTSNRYGLVIQFLTQFNNNSIGQSLLEPIRTITTSPGHFGQISVHAVSADILLNSIGKEAKDQDEVDEILQKCTWVSQFIIEYYGCGTGQSLWEPIHTIVTKDRFALVTVMGNDYIIMDIFLRMLKAEPELKLGQGFPADYIIDRDYKGISYSPVQQVAKIGNSVVPIIAQALVKANLPELCVAERTPNMQVVTGENGQMKFA